ncbi:MAG: type I-E CRISPR-associated protein Cas6/Cse3/CasE [Clostridia bacterium]|nr:type I-E CRISPR-associated protein Cas6/Cse3/CasE [Clostridia bacterium]
MYLSRIKLDTSRTETMRALASPSVFHGAIESADEERTRKLWRLDTLYGDQILLILTEKQIDLSGVSEQFSYDGTFETKVYDGLLDRITNGSRWQFRLKANPTIQKFDKKKGRGKVLAHITTEYQGEWLKKQAEKNGFALNDDEWLVTGSRWYIFKKNRHKKDNVRMLAATYEGVLTVTDAEAFKNALTKGIGREKAFGMGLLTVTRVMR